MSTHSDLLTPAEAAVVAGVSLRDVHRVIDEDILPTSLVCSEAGRRWLRSDACTYLRFYFYSAKALTADERLLTIRRCTEAKALTWSFHHDFLTVDLRGFHKITERRHAALVRARETVMEDPEILGGVPVIRGTRIPVYDVAASLTAGYDRDRIKAAYPSLDDNMIELARLYAEANPPRGRPRKSPAEAGLELRSERRIERRRRP